jgi:hypothetical protein
VISSVTDATLSSGRFGVDVFNDTAVGNLIVDAFRGGNVVAGCAPGSLALLGVGAE